ncbi:3145_t:CDS:2 [Ambispora gerdemannii]|uniref:3145_t:CDS:1 n=1 Tax=Ambispora gerdemannii TaxID=144530 RepID=A0A9N9D7G3_9GLOM|nr:3145_t:CDS:2 [Ambispora gerdemannii]
MDNDCGPYFDCDLFISDKCNQNIFSWYIHSSPGLYSRPAFEAYHDATHVYHQQKFDELYPKKYRMISLSVYGDPSDTRYAAVWVQTQLSPDWMAIHGATPSQYQSFFDKCAQGGYSAILITATGNDSKSVFAGTCEKRPGPLHLTKFGLVRGSDSETNTIQYWNKQAYEQGLILTSGSVYGSASNPVFAAIWSSNTDNISWNADGIVDDAATYQSRFNAETSVWARPSFVTLSSSYQYFSVFVDNQIGPWVARHGLTSSQYQAEFDKWVAQGYYPFSVQGGGSGSGIRIAVIFAKDTIPIPRNFTASGLTTVQSIDDVMKDYIKKNQIHGASLGIVLGKKLVYAKGYTWAEPGYPAIQPTTPFRVASCSKSITSIAIHQLIQEKLLSLDDRFQDILQLKTPSGGDPSDPNIKKVTIRQLLEHKGGFSDAWHRDVATVKAFGTSLPITKLQLARYIMTEKLQFEPGTQYLYSNFGYILLSLVVEKKRGTLYESAVLSTIGKPLGLSRTRLSRTLLSSQLTGEARYHDWKIGVSDSVMTPDEPLVPYQYGGFDIQNQDGGGGWSVAAVDFARILAGLSSKSGKLLNNNTTFDMLENLRGFDQRYYSNPDGWHYVKGGYISGLQSIINFDDNQFSYFIAWNKNELKGQFYPNFPELEAAFKSNNWGNTDLFPSYDMPAL